MVKPTEKKIVAFRKYLKKKKKGFMVYRGFQNEDLKHSNTLGGHNQNIF